MHIPVLVEPVAANGFRALAGGPFGFTAEGATREEAVQNLRQQIQSHLAAGGQLLSLEVPEPQHPLAPFAGMFQDNPLFDEWQQAIAEMRRREDEDLDVP
jgi:predicted RNase H-like HicB family nuclease